MSNLSMINTFSGSLAETLLFGLFASVLLIGSLGVILGRNSVYSVLFLILAFFNGAGLFVLLQAELIAMTLVIVYVGAVAILFLFVVMMLNINFKDLQKDKAKYMPFALVSGALIAVELITMGCLWKSPNTLSYPPVQPNEYLSNTHAIGNILYTEYILPFQLSGFILLVAMIGAIVLTLRKRPDVQRQNIQEQLKRSPTNTLTMHKIAPKQGIKL